MQFLDDLAHPKAFQEAVMRGSFRIMLATYDIEEQYFSCQLTFHPKIKCPYAMILQLFKKHTF